MKNLRQIKVKFLGPTNSRGARIKIYEPSRFNDRPTYSKIFPYCYSTGDIKAQAIDILQANGFEIVATASEYQSEIILCDNWADNYKDLNELI
jgi:hypothetical protein